MRDTEIREVLADMEIDVDMIGTGGNMRALQAVLETGHYMWVTNSDGDLPAVVDDLLVGVYEQLPQGEEPLFYVETSDPTRLRFAVTTALAKLVSGDHTDTTLS